MGKKAQTVAFVTCVKSGVAKQDLGSPTPRPSVLRLPKSTLLIYMETMTNCSPGRGVHLQPIKLQGFIQEHWNGVGVNSCSVSWLARAFSQRPTTNDHRKSYHPQRLSILHTPKLGFFLEHIHHIQLPGIRYYTGRQSKHLVKITRDGEMLPPPLRILVPVYSSSNCIISFIPSCCARSVPRPDQVVD